jgi:hypothetical protein
MFADTDFFFFFFFFFFFKFKVKLLGSVLHFRTSFLFGIGIASIFQILILYLEF